MFFRHKSVFLLFVSSRTKKLGISGDKLTEKGKFAVDSKDSVLTHIVSMFADITICMSFIS